MSLLLFPFSVISQPLWSSYAAAKVGNDFIWINKIIKRLYFFSLIIIFGIILFSVYFDFITLFWLGNIYEISFIFKVLVGLLLFNVMWSTIHADILYGFSLYKFMSITIFIGLLIKISILIFMIKINYLTISGIVISSIFGYSLFSVTAPFYIRKKIRNKQCE